MLPDGWTRRTLGEIARITSGGTPDRAEPSYWGGDIPWVTTGEIQFNTITDTTEKITELGLKNSSAKLFPPGTLLMAMYGQGKTRGQVAKLGIEAATNQNSAAILLQPDQDPDYHFHYLAARYDEIRELGHSGGVSHLNAGLLKQIEIPCAPFEQQQYIGRMLGVWDDTIAATERLLANSRKQKSDLMSMLLRRSSTRSNGDAFRTVELNSLFERVARKNADGNDNVLTISAQYGLISQRDFFNKSVASRDLSGYTLLKRGEFAYNKSYSNGYPVGAIKPLIAYEAGVVSSLYLCFRLRDGAEADQDFFRHYFEAGMLDDDIAGIAQEGARNHGLLNVGIAEFFGLQLRVPNLEAQRRIAKVLNTAEAEEKTIAEQIDRLRSEKRALMADLLTGKRQARLNTVESPP